MPNHRKIFTIRFAPLLALIGILFLISACEPLLLTPIPGDADAGSGIVATGTPVAEAAIDGSEIMTATETVSLTQAITLPAVVSKVLLPTPTPSAVEVETEAEADAADEMDTAEALTVTTPITVAADVVALAPMTASVEMTSTVAPSVTTELTATDGLTTTDELIATVDLTRTDELTVTDGLTATVTPTATSDISATEAVTAVAALVRYGVVNADRLNVRNAPSTEGDVIAKLLIGDRVLLLAENEAGDWVAVQLDGVDGDAWIATEFVDEAEAEPEPNPATTDEAETEKEVVSEPESTATDEAAASDETSAETAEEPVAEAESDPEVARPEPDVPTAYTQPDRMNVREGPGTNFAVVTNVAAGTALDILASNAGGDWYQVRLPDQEEPGWIYASLTDTAGPIETVQPLPDEQLPEPPPEAVAAAPVVAAVVSAPPPAGGGFFGYGVQAHMLGGGIDPALDATAGMGFNWIKQQVEWRHFEGSPGAIDFSELRRITDSAGARGINVLFSVVNSPDWAREAGFDGGVGGPPADPGTYATFVGRMAGEFCGSQLKAIEVWNEQNLHYEWGNKPLNPADYMNLLRPAYAAIKAACPSMLVISGALTPAGDAGPYARDDYAYLEGMYQNGLAGYADGIGAHPSGYNVPPSVGWQDACAVIQQTGNFFNGPCDTPHHSWSFRSTMEGYRNIMNVYGDSYKRVWPTEFGWAVGPAVNGSYAYANDNSAEEQAAWTVEAYQMMRNWGWAGPAFLWNLNFRVVADGSEKAQWGIVRNDYGPLPTYQALQGMGK